MGFLHLGLDGTLLKRRQWQLNSLLVPMSCSVTFKLGISFSAASLSLICCKICMGSLSGVVSAASLSHWRVLICYNLVSLSAVVSAAKRSHWQVLVPLPLAVWAEHLLLRFLNLSCFCLSVSAGIARSLLLSAVCVSHEAGSLLPSVFTLSTQLLALAIHTHTVGTHASHRAKNEISCLFCMQEIWHFIHCSPPIL